MQADINQFLNLLHTDWKTAGTYLLGGLFIAVMTQVIRHWHGLTVFAGDVRKHATGISRAIVTGCSFIVAAANYILNNGAGPLAGLFAHFAILLSAAHIVYWVSVSPAYKWTMKQLTDAANWRQANAPQPVTPAEAPLSTFPD